MGALFRWIGTACGCIVLAGVIFGSLIEAGIVPSDRVLSGDRIPPDQVAVLRSEGILDDGEEVEYFYSEGLFSIREGGSLLTDRRVIAYEANRDDGVDIYELGLHEIESVEMTQPGDSLSFTVYTVSGESEGDWLDLWLPHEHGDGELFANAVRARIQ